MTALRAWSDGEEERKAVDWQAHCEAEVHPERDDLCRCEHRRRDHQGGGGECDRPAHPLCGCVRFRPNTRTGSCVVCHAPTSDNNDLCVAHERDEDNSAERYRREHL